MRQSTQAQRRPTRVSQRLAILLVLLLAVGCSDGSSDASPPATNATPPPTASSFGGLADEYTGHGPKVAIIGDSLTVAAWSGLYDALADDYAVRIGAYQGEGYNAGSFTAALKKLDRTSTTTGTDGKPALDISLENGILAGVADEFAKSRPDIVVLAIGTNDAWNRRPTDVAVSTMNKMVAAFRPACLVGMTLTERSKAEGWSDETAHDLNVAMRSWANEVVDWARISEQPGMLGDGHVHPTPAGEQALTKSIVAAVRECKT